MQVLDAARSTDADAQANSAADAIQSALFSDDNSKALCFRNLPTIIRILDDACSKRATLTIKLEVGTRLHIYHSRIQSVDTVHMQMVLQKLTPTNWYEFVQQETEVEVSCQLPSGLLRFSSTLAPLEAETPTPYCVLAVPELLYKHQLRSSYRVMLPPGSTSLGLPLGDRTLNGYCLNLSLDGCCGIFRGNLAAFERDVIVPALSVSLDDSLQFTTEAIVCRRSLMQNGSTQLGLRFEPLGAELQRKLQTSLTSLQRRQLRKNG